MYIAISVPQSTKPSNIRKLLFCGIEIVTTQLVLPTAVQLALVYRSLSVPVTTFLIGLANLLNDHLCHDLPTIILGDFNDDIKDNAPSKVLRLVHNMTIELRLVSFRKLPSILSICEHAPYDKTNETVE